MKKELGIAVLLVVLCATLAILAPNSLRPANIDDMLRRISEYGVFGIGAGIVIITGGIDLSVGSLLALQGVIMCMLLRDHNMAWPGAIGLTMLSMAVLGAIHGVLVTRVKLPPFIVTLCGLMIYRSLARSISHDESKGLGVQSYGFLKSMASGEIYLSPRYTIPSAFVVLLIVSVIMYVLLHRSIFGRYLYAVGRNEEAARYSGINTKLVIGSAYVIAAVLTGISGILLMFDIQSVTPSNSYNAYEMYGIAAAVLGGCSLLGGEGSIIGIILGTALIQVLLNFVQLLGIPSTWELAVMGSVILVGVIFDQILKSRKKKTPAAIAVSQAPASPPLTPSAH